MKRKKIEACRNEAGYINLNNLNRYREKGEIVEGSNAKTWFNVEGVRILFKEYSSVLPAFGEVLYYKVARECGVNCAEYDFAEYNGKRGTISYDFLGKDRFYYNFLELTTQFSDTKFTYEERVKNRELLVLHNNKYNNLSSIKVVLGEIFNISEEEKKKIELELVKMICLDTVFWHRDRNLWNYGVVVDESTDTMALAAVHDNSYVLCLEKGEEYIEKMIVALINGGRLGDIYTENSTFNITFDDDMSMQQLIDFYENSDLIIRETIEDVINRIDVEGTATELCKSNKIGDVPALWIKAVLNYRKNTILKGLENVKIKDEVAHKPNNITFSKRK